MVDYQALSTKASGLSIVVHRSRGASRDVV
jgi:hypothetical protein